MKWVGGGGSIGFSYFSIQFISLVMICIDNCYVSDSFFFVLDFPRNMELYFQKKIVQETISVLFFKKIHKK